jgi:hypothetical protein
MLDSNYNVLFYRTQFHPVTEMVTVQWKLRRLQVDRIPSADGLITPVVGQNFEEEEDHYLEFKYEYPVQRPEERKKISINANCLEFIYHTETIRQLVKCFRIPSEIEMRN